MYFMFFLLEGHDAGTGMPQIVKADSFKFCCFIGRVKDQVNPVYMNHRMLLKMYHLRSVGRFKGRIKRAVSPINMAKEVNAQL